MKTERTTLNGCFHCTHVKRKRRERRRRRRKVQRQEGNRSDSLGIHPTTSILRFLLIDHATTVEKIYNSNWVMVFITKVPQTRLLLTAS